MPKKTSFRDKIFNTIAKFKSDHPFYNLKVDGTIEDEAEYMKCIETTNNVSFEIKAGKSLIYSSKNKSNVHFRLHWVKDGILELKPSNKKECFQTVLKHSANGYYYSNSTHFVIDKKLCPIMESNACLRKSLNYIKIECETEDLLTYSLNYMNWLNEIIAKLNYIKFKNEKGITPVFLAKQISDYIFKPLNAEYVTDIGETRIIMESAGGPIMFAINGSDISNCKSYDCNSRYPSLMAKDFKIPIKQGKLTRVDKIENKNSIYKLNILGLCNDRFGIFKKPRSWFHYNDILIMKLYNIDFELDTESDFNCLLYENKVCFDLGFFMKKIIYDLYGLKSNKNKLAKLVLNCFWGIFSSTNEYEIDTENMSKDEYESLKHRITKDHPIKKTVTVMSEDRTFKTFLGRIKPLILSLARLAHAKECFINELEGGTVYRINTDSFVSDKAHSSLKIGNKIGQYKIEKSFDDNTTLAHINKFETKP